MQTMIFLSTVLALGPGFGWHNQSARDIHDRDNPKTQTKTMNVIVPSESANQQRNPRYATRQFDPPRQISPERRGVLEERILGTVLSILVVTGTAVGTSLEGPELELSLTQPSQRPGSPKPPPASRDLAGKNWRRFSAWRRAASASSIPADVI
jgi:hypothetical protein